MSLRSASPLFGSYLPRVWAFVAINLLSQFVCLRGVNSLMASSGPLTVNTALTARKFFSLLFRYAHVVVPFCWKWLLTRLPLLSVYYFANPFTAVHWAGAALVFGGCFLYSVVPGVNSSETPIKVYCHYPLATLVTVEHEWFLRRGPMTS